MAKRTRPAVWHGGLALALVLSLTALLFAVFRLPWTWYHLLAALLLSVNLVTFGYYGYDKGRSRSQSSRVPEVVLHGLVFLGGTIGAYLGMIAFRHKTIKSSFRLVFWTVAVLQVFLILAVLYRLWK